MTHSQEFNKELLQFLNAIKWDNYKSEESFNAYSDFMVRYLEGESVEYIFGIPGEENIDLIDSLEQSSIQFVPTHHEQGAAFMADTYGRLIVKPGVCLVKLDPGTTNLITGVANA